MAALAGAAVLLGINSVEKRCNNDNQPTEDSDDILVSGSSIVEETEDEEDCYSSPKKQSFAKRLKKAQSVIERISSVVTCICRIVDCIGDLFKENRYNSRSYSSSYCGTTIII